MNLLPRYFSTTIFQYEIFRAMVSIGIDTMRSPCSALYVEVVRNSRQAWTNYESHKGSHVCSECQSNGNLKQAWVNGGRSHDSLKVASALTVKLMDIQTSVAPAEIQLEMLSSMKRAIERMCGLPSIREGIRRRGAVGSTAHIPPLHCACRECVSRRSSLACVWLKRIAIETVRVSW